MAAEQFKASESIEANETTESGDVIRHGIAQMLSDPYFQSTLDKEALQNYQDLVNKKGHIKPNDTENLSRFYEFMKNQFKDIRQMKKRITGHVKQAIQDRAIMEKDRIFYKEKMKENVVSGKQVVTKEILEQAEKDILESLENRRKERKEYDKIAKSPLVKNDHLIVSDSKNIRVPNENQYLQMTVPERRKWLEKIREEIPKAKKYAGKKEEAKAKKLEKEYETLLKAAKKEGIIGEEVSRKFMEWFKGQNNEKKQYAIGQFFKQMKRYKKLNDEINSTLSGTALVRMKKMKKTLGYTNLKNEFQKVMADEYGKRLKNEPLSRHSKREYSEDMRNQSYENQMMYLKKFDQEMKHHRILWSKINQLKDKNVKRVLLEMYESDDNGYSKIQAKYNRLTGQKISETSDGKKTEPSIRILSTITNETVKKEILHAGKVLNQAQKKTFTERITHFFLNKQSAEQDATTYQKNIQAARREHENAYSQREDIETFEPEELALDKNSKDTNRSLGIHDIDEKATERLKPKTKKTKTIQKTKAPEVRIKKSTDRAYQQNALIDKKGKKRRVVRVGGTKEAVRAFNNETLLNPDQDELSLMAKDGHHIVEMKMHEIRVMKKYLREGLSQSSEDIEKEAA